MADLVRGLESAPNSTADILSSKIRKQVQRFDQYKKHITKGDGTDHVLRSALPTSQVHNTASTPAQEINDEGSVSTIQTDYHSPCG